MIAYDSYGKYFGGYAKESWNKNGNYITDEDAFLFSITRNKKYECTTKSYALHGHSSYGPTFGNSALRLQD